MRWSRCLHYALMCAMQTGRLAAAAADGRTACPDARRQAGVQVGPGFPLP